MPFINISLTGSNLGYTAKNQYVPVAGLRSVWMSVIDEAKYTVRYISPASMNELSSVFHSN